MKISQKIKLTNFENCNDNLWTPCVIKKFLAIWHKEKRFLMMLKAGLFQNLIQA